MSERQSRFWPMKRLKSEAKENNSFVACTSLPNHVKAYTYTIEFVYGIINLCFIPGNVKCDTSKTEGPVMMNLTEAIVALRRGMYFSPCLLIRK